MGRSLPMGLADHHGESGNGLAGTGGALGRRAARHRDRVHGVGFWGGDDGRDLASIADDQRNRQGRPTLGNVKLFWA